MQAQLLKNEPAQDILNTLPATYHYDAAYKQPAVGNPADEPMVFLQSELCLGTLTDMLKYLWFAGRERPAMPLHVHIAIGREIAVNEQMNLHLLWDNKGRLFIKPIPRFLLDLSFCHKYLWCSDGCPSHNPPMGACPESLRKVALGFLYTYACLISSEYDFHLANENRLLPRNDDDTVIEWPQWKIFARELLQIYEAHPDAVHPRFLRAELRLSRINIIHSFTRLPPFKPYHLSRHTYSSLFHDYLTSLAVATVFVALVLTAMQVGLATERLQGNAAFQHASYGFTIFSILGPMCVSGLTILYVVYYLITDFVVPHLLAKRRSFRANSNTSA